VLFFATLKVLKWFWSCNCMCWPWRVFINAFRINIWSTIKHSDAKI